jgi:hypothetical protein
MTIIVPLSFFLLQRKTDASTYHTHIHSCLHSNVHTVCMCMWCMWCLCVCACKVPRICVLHIIFPYGPSLSVVVICAVPTIQVSMSHGGVIIMWIFLYNAHILSIVPHRLAVMSYNERTHCCTEELEENVDERKRTERAIALSSLSPSLSPLLFYCCY